MGELPWRAGSATGIGSLPGTDIAEAVKTVFGELPQLPYLPELPARGPGADMTGRSAGLLVDFPVELYAARWRLADRPGQDSRRTADLRERDLDALTDYADGYAGPMKLQSAGPWTLATQLELRTGGPVLRDTGAVRDLADSLADGLRRHVADVSARVPGARVLLQLDEASLPAVLDGRVPTESGLGALPAASPATVTEVLRTVVTTAGVPVVVHCCAPDPPVRLMREAGALAVSVDLDLVSDPEPVGELVDAGLGLFAGAVPTRAIEMPDATEVDDRILRLWGRLGLPEEWLAERVVVTQACGLAGAFPEYARAALSTCRTAGRGLVERSR